MASTGYGISAHHQFFHNPHIYPARQSESGLEEVEQDEVQTKDQMYDEKRHVEFRLYQLKILEKHGHAESYVNYIKSMLKDKQCTDDPAASHVLAAHLKNAIFQLSRYPNVQPLLHEAAFLFIARCWQYIFPVNIQEHPDYATIWEYGKKNMTTGTLSSNIEYLLEQKAPSLQIQLLTDEYIRLLRENPPSPLEWFEAARMKKKCSLMEDVKVQRQLVADLTSIIPQTLEEPTNLHSIDAAKRRVSETLPTLQRLINTLNKVEPTSEIYRINMHSIGMILKSCYIEDQEMGVLDENLLPYYAQFGRKLLTNHSGSYCLFPFLLPHCIHAILEEGPLDPSALKILTDFLEKEKELQEKTIQARREVSPKQLAIVHYIEGVIHEVFCDDLKLALDLYRKAALENLLAKARVSRLEFALNRMGQQLFSQVFDQAWSIIDEKRMERIDQELRKNPCAFGLCQSFIKDCEAESAENLAEDSDSLYLKACAKLSNALSPSASTQFLFRLAQEGNLIAKMYLFDHFLDPHLPSFIASTLSFEELNTLLTWAFDKRYPEVLNPIQTKLRIWVSDEMIGIADKLQLLQQNETVVLKELQIDSECQLAANKLQALAENPITEIEMLQILDLIEKTKMNASYAAKKLHSTFILSGAQLQSLHTKLGGRIQQTSKELALIATSIDQAGNDELNIEAHQQTLNHLDETALTLDAQLAYIQQSILLEPLKAAALQAAQKIIDSDRPKSAQVHLYLAASSPLFDLQKACELILSLSPEELLQHQIDKKLISYLEREDCTERGLIHFTLSCIYQKSEKKTLVNKGIKHLIEAAISQKQPKACCELWKGLKDSKNRALKLELKKFGSSIFDQVLENAALIGKDPEAMLLLFRKYFNKEQTSSQSNHREKIQHLIDQIYDVPGTSSISQDLLKLSVECYFYYESLGPRSRIHLPTEIHSLLETLAAQKWPKAFLYLAKISLDPQRQMELFEKGAELGNTDCMIAQFDFFFSHGDIHNAILIGQRVAEILKEETPNHIIIHLVLYFLHVRNDAKQSQKFIEFGVKAADSACTLKYLSGISLKDYDLSKQDLRNLIFTQAASIFKKETIHRFLSTSNTQNQLRNTICMMAKIKQEEFQKLVKMAESEEIDEKRLLQQRVKADVRKGPVQQAAKNAMISFESSSLHLKKKKTIAVQSTLLQWHYLMLEIDQELRKADLNFAQVLRNLRIHRDEITLGLYEALTNHERVLEGIEPKEHEQDLKRPALLLYDALFEGNFRKFQELILEMGLVEKEEKATTLSSNPMAQNYLEKLLNALCLSSEICDQQHEIIVAYMLKMLGPSLSSSFLEITADDLIKKQRPCPKIIRRLQEAFRAKVQTVSLAGAGGEQRLQLTPRKK